MGTHEYRIYTEIAYLIFIKCLDKSGIKEERGWPAKLSDALDRQFKNNHLDAKALSDLFNRIKRSKATENTLEEVTISELTLSLLAEFAGIKDYKTYNTNFKGLNVVYAKKPFPYLNLLRIPSNGWLTGMDNYWTFQSDSECILADRTTEHAEPYRMPGDHQHFWVKVEYNDDSGIGHTAYFALIENQQPLTFSTPKPLQDFFERFQDKSSKQALR